MKFNLKNFPLKVNQQGIDITLLTTSKLTKDDEKIIKIAEWKVGFEKELREKLDIHSVGENLFTNGYVFALKEILGK